MFSKQCETLCYHSGNKLRYFKDKVEMLSWYCCLSLLVLGETGGGCNVDGMRVTDEDMFS